MNVSKTMVRGLIFTILLLLHLANSFAQDNSVMNIHFQWNWAGPATIGANDSLGMVLVLTSEPYGKTQYDQELMIVKYDQCGNIDWIRTIGSKTHVANYLHKATGTILSNGDVLVIGWGGSVFRFNSEGKLIENYDTEKKFEYMFVEESVQDELIYIHSRWGTLRLNQDLSFVSHIDNFPALYNTPPDGIALSKHGGIINADYSTIIKEDKNGSVEWAYEVEKPKSDHFSFGEILALDDGYVLGATQAYKGQQTSYLVKIDLDGKFLWKSKAFLGYSEEILVNADNEIVIVKNDLHQKFTRELLKFSPSGKFKKAVRILPADTTDLNYVGFGNAVSSVRSFYLTFQMRDKQFNDWFSFVKIDDDLRGNNCIQITELDLFNSPGFKLNEVTITNRDFRGYEKEDNRNEIIDTYFDTTYYCKEHLPGREGNLTDTILCFQDTLEVKLTSKYHYYLWSDSSTADSLLITESGNYWLELGNACDNHRYDFHVGFREDPLLNYLIKPKQGDLFTEFYFESRTENAFDVKWDLGDSNIDERLSFYHQYEKNGIYPVNYSFRDTFNCFYDHTTDIRVQLLKIHIPNTLTPNGDGLNDGFRPVGHGFISYHMRIYNRWGEEIHDQANSTWYPGNLPMGKYLYEIEFIDDFGDPHARSGTVLLLK